jgi:cation diffusion facilitator family transporter
VTSTGRARPHGAHPHPHQHAEHGHDHDQRDHDHDHDRQHGLALSRFLRGLVHPHSHDHLDSTGLTDSRDGARALVVSLTVLGATALLQVVVVTLSGSVALLADTIHNFSDALTAVPLGIAFWLGRRPPTRRYTYGFGRAEDLAGVLIVVTIAVSAAVAAWQAIDRLVDPPPVHNVGWVFAAGVVGFLGNELVAVYRIRVGRRIGSAALVADGLHARTDGFTSLAVVAGAAGAAAGWEAADPVAGLVISLAILGVLRIAARDIYRRLMDSAEPGIVDAVEAELARTPRVVAVDRVRLRWVGHRLHADAEIACDPGLTLSDAHHIAELARHGVLHEITHLADALIHVSPPAHTEPDPHAVTRHHF